MGVVGGQFRYAFRLAAAKGPKPVDQAVAGAAALKGQHCLAAYVVGAADGAWPSGAMTTSSAKASMRSSLSSSGMSTTKAASSPFSSMSS